MSGEGETMSNQGVLEQSTTIMKEIQAGRDLLGYIYPHVPLELILAHGLTPTLLRAMPGVPSGFESSLQTFACSYARNLFSLRSEDQMMPLAGILFPSNTCDSLQNLADVWKYRFPRDKVLRLSYPVSRGGSMKAAEAFLAAELEQLSKSIETTFNKPFVKQNYERAVAFVRDFREAAQFLYASRMAGGDITYDELATLIRSFLTNPSPGVLADIQKRQEDIERQLHPEGLLEIAHRIERALVESDFTALNESITKLRETYSGIVRPDIMPRILVVGGMVEPQSVSTLFDGISATSSSAIQLDLLSFGFKAVFREPIDTSEDLFIGLSRSLLSAHGEPTQEGLESRVEYVSSLIRALSITGLVICEQSFCDPDQFEAPSLERAAKETGIRSVRLPMDPELSDRARLEGRLESFIESLQTGT